MKKGEVASKYFIMSSPHVYKTSTHFDSSILLAIGGCYQLPQFSRENKLSRSINLSLTCNHFIIKCFGLI